MKLEEIFPIFADKSKLKELNKLKSEFKEALCNLVEFSDKYSIPFALPTREFGNFQYFPHSFIENVEKYDEKAKKLSSFDGKTICEMLDDEEFEDNYLDDLYFIQDAIHNGGGWESSWNR